MVRSRSIYRQGQKEVDSTKTRFVYAGWLRIAEYDGSDTLIARYVYGISLEEPLIVVAVGGELTYLHHDHVGSIIAISDNTGSVTSNYKYTPWGESPGVSGTTFGFTGSRNISKISSLTSVAMYQSLGIMDSANPYEYPLTLNDKITAIGIATGVLTVSIQK